MILPHELALTFGMSICTPFFTVHTCPQFLENPGTVRDQVSSEKVAASKGLSQIRWPRETGQMGTALPTHQPLSSQHTEEEI